MVLGQAQSLLCAPFSHTHNLSAHLVRAACLHFAPKDTDHCLDPVLTSTGTWSSGVQASAPHGLYSSQSLTGPRMCCSWEDSEDLAVSANDFMRSGLQAAYKVPLVKKVR